MDKSYFRDLEIEMCLQSVDDLLYNCQSENDEKINFLCLLLCHDGGKLVLRDSHT